MILLPVRRRASVVAPCSARSPGRGRGAAQRSLLAALATGSGVSLYLLTQFDAGRRRLPVRGRPRPGSRDLGISLHFGVDGISLFLVVLTGIMFPIAILGAKLDHDPKPYYGWLLVLMAGVDGRVQRTRPGGVLRLLRDRARARCTSSSGCGATASGSTRRPSSSCTRCSARRSCWSASSALAVLNQRAIGGPLTFDLVEIAENQAISVDAGPLDLRARSPSRSR